MRKNNQDYLEDTIIEDGEAFSATTLIEHLRELKKRVILGILAYFIACLICYGFIEHIYSFLVQPLADIYQGADRKMIFTGLSEAFFTYLRLSMAVGFILAFPAIAWQVYAFVAPGLFKSERRFLLIFTSMAPILFLLGAALAYYFVFPMAWKFFVSFEMAPTEGSLPILLEARVSEYLSLVMSLILGFGLAFQLPIVLILLCKFGVVTADILIKGRKYALIIILIIAAILTPPDVFSQITLAIPLQLLYEISIFFCKMIDKQKLEETEEDAQYQSN